MRAGLVLTFNQATVLSAVFSMLGCGTCHDRSANHPFTTTDSTPITGNLARTGNCSPCGQVLPCLTQRPLRLAHRVDPHIAWSKWPGHDRNQRVNDTSALLLNRPALPCSTVDLWLAGSPTSRGGPGVWSKTSGGSRAPPKMTTVLRHDVLVCPVSHPSFQL